jgi:hypothetical protein
VPLGSGLTSVAASGGTAYVTNRGNNTLRVVTFSTSQDRVVTVSASGSLASVALPSGADFVQNQTATPQIGGFSVTGAGTVGGLLTAGSATVAGTVFSSSGGFKFPDGTTQTTAATTTASNGLTQSGNNIALGGTLTQATTLATGGFNLSVTGTGNVGIGTAPAAGLHVDRPETGNQSSVGILLGGGTTGNPSLEMRGVSKTPYIDFSEATGVDYSTRLLSNGGTLNVYGTNGTSLRVNGNAVVTGTMTVNGVNVTSDQRFKQHIRPLGGALSTVLALRGVRYDWNALGVRHGGTAGAEQVGLIAQELEKVYPELVSTDAQGYKAVNYAQLTPVLIEALKEQQAQIEALKARAATAETKAARATATLETFEARLRRLEGGSEGQARR